MYLFPPSPMRGRPGSRAAWGGEIGGVQVGHMPSNPLLRAVSSNSMSSGDSMGLDFRIGYVRMTSHAVAPSPVGLTQTGIFFEVAHFI